LKDFLNKERQKKMTNYSSHIAEIMRDYKLMSRISFLRIHSEQDYQDAKREIEKQQHEERIDGLRYGN
jgi:hypothetical protein